MKEHDPRLKVLLADDHTRVLTYTAQLLTPDYHIVATATDGLLAVKAASQFKPGVAVLDIEMPGLDGIRAAQEMRRLELEARIIFLTIYDEEDYIIAARKYGNGYVLKSRMATDLCRAIAECLSGRFFLSHRTVDAG